MPDDQESYRITAAKLGMVMLHLESFIVEIIRHVRSGQSLDDEALTEIAAECLRASKNTEMTGAPIELEAEIIGQASEMLNYIIQSAIRRGKGDKV